MGIGPRRDSARKDADHRLEQALNGLRASKCERTEARYMFARLVSSKPRVGFNAAQKQVLRALEQGRQERNAGQPDTPARQA